MKDDSDRCGAIVVGASSGIGEAVARALADEGYAVGLTARRVERLREIAVDLPTDAYVAAMDVAVTQRARETFDDLCETMDSVDLVVISAGVGPANRDLEWGPERETIAVNVCGFAAISTAALAHFERRGSGHLVGISSVASVFGNGVAPAYNASKAFVSTYLEGLRYRQAGRESEIAITTVEPGYVDTDLAAGEFWMCSPETAAEQIVRAIDARREHVYVTRRWRLVAWLLALLPERVLRRPFT
ncbi:SDR family NAD(P)-dependent oxidoreductase [Natrononativus amylolyticus]|uniref:SDR family NAD(P)-dependent oxidoreductase n=1 Tax=Natrononativus amylolyticus TaxID=2963434 RepID=UPI0020CC5547|nr:SDR family NAD(P)-dependent oxidoreductase [Natrononativus amylolyticus]